MSNFSNSSFYFTPSGYGENQIQAQNPLSTIGAMTFSRTSTATRTDIENNVREVPYNLISSGIAAPSFYTTQTNITSFSVNTTPPPVNISSGVFKLIPNATSGQHNAYGSVAFINPEKFTYSAYVQASGYNYVSLGIDTGLVGSTIIFNLADGTFSGSETGITPFISNVGNSWFRIGFTNTNVLTTTTNVYLIVRNNNTTSNYSGDTTSGILVCAPQIAFGGLPQQYFSTANRLNVPRLDYSQGIGCLLLEPQRTNSIYNSTMQGASVGTNTIPTYWTIINNSTMTYTVVGLGVEYGMNYIDLKVSGVASSANADRIAFNTNTQIAASTGQNWTNSFYTKIVTSVKSPDTIVSRITQRNSSFGVVTSTEVPVTVSNTLTRSTNCVLLGVNASTSWLNSEISLGHSIGLSYDYTIRIAAPQLELGAFATTYIPTTNASSTRIVDAFSMSNVYTNNLVGASGGTWFIKLKNNITYTRDSFGGIILDSNSGGFTTGITIRDSNTTESLSIQIRNSTIGTGTYIITSLNPKIIAKWNGSTADVFVDGAKVITSATMSSNVLQYLNTVSLGVPIYIETMALYNTPLSDAQCISLTT